MSTRIYGDKDTIERARRAKPGDPHVYVNMEAIMELPEQFEVHIEKVKFDFNQDFVDVGGTFMPTPKLMNAIAEARGIEGTTEIHVESIIEEVDINPLLCKPLDAEPTIRRMIVGKRSIKTGKVLNEDGTWRQSDPCAVDYNAWERCLIEWSKEEEITDGYNTAGRKVNQGGNTFYERQWYNKEKRQTESGAYYPKYDNRFKRQRHLTEAMKFAQRQADTKARNIVIRVLAGLKTGYQKDELKDGYFIFPRIRRSREILKLETAADLQARAKGLTGRGDQATALLFGPSEASAPQEDDFPTDPEPEPAKKEISKREHMVAILKAYQKDDLIAADLKESAVKVIAWLEKTPDAEQDAKYWPKAIEIHRKIETKIPSEGRIDHKIF